MNKYTLECCVDSVESALAAVQGGATRLELCANLVIGGTTPSVALFEEIRKRTDIRVHALLRPRFGDFLYTQSEADVLLREVCLFRDAGAQGVVIGCLDADGRLNMPVMKRLAEAARGMSVTLHRAIDVCADPFEALSQAKDLGVSAILTSGGKETALAGKARLRELADRAEGIEIMAGAGIGAEAIGELLRDTGLHSFHMSGKQTLQSGMRYRNPDVSMGLPSLSEYEIWQTDAGAVARARQVLDSWDWA